MSTRIAPDRLEELERKLDGIAEQLALVSAEAREARARRERWDELRDDAMPLAAGAVTAVTARLDEIARDVSPEEIVDLLTRLVRAAPTLNAMLEQAGSLHDLASDAVPLGGEVVERLVAALASLEQRGYFEFARGGAGVLDRIVTSFGEEDIESLGDNIVLILNTVKEMTQPEVMMMLRRTALTMRAGEPVTDVSLFRLLGQMRDPQVKRGLARLISMLRSMGDGAAVPTQITTNANPQGGSHGD